MFACWRDRAEQDSARIERRNLAYQRLVGPEPGLTVERRLFDDLMASTADSRPAAVCRVTPVP